MDVSRQLLEDAYQDHILVHFEMPDHRDEFVTATHCQTLRNPSCGDQVKLQFCIDSNGQIEKARFEATGCVISQAATSILCEFCECKQFHEVCQLQADQMLALLRVPLTPHRQQCGLLAWKALQQMLANSE